MKYFHLIWAALFRRKTRTILTLVSIAAAFLLFGMLDAVRTSFDQAGKSANGAQRLQTGSKLSFIQTLPQGLGQQIATVPGVKSVAYSNWFGGAYQDPHNQVFTFAVSDNYIDQYPEVAVSDENRKTFLETRTGILVGDKLMEKYHWKVGDQIPLQSNIFPQQNGSKNWTFNIVGVMHPKEASAGFYSQIILMHWKYFDDSVQKGYNGGNVGWFVTRVNDVNQADRVAKAIDALSANSDHETRTQTEAAATASWMKQLADIGLIVGSIMGAVFFTLLLLTGNTMMQAVRERTSELAVMKTLGFSDRSVLAMVLAESILLVLLGGVIGIGLAALLIPGVSANSGGMLNLPTVGANSWALGIGLMLLIGAVVGAIPAWRAMRLNIVDALAGR
jgi:putative ABC transport system permease protein